MAQSCRLVSRVGGVAALLLAEVVAVVVLYRLGHTTGFALPRHAFGQWARAAPTEVLVAALGRLAGLTIGAWLVATTALSMARRVVPAWRSVRAFDFATPRSVRRLLDRTLVVGLGASLAMTAARPAAAGTDAPVPRVPPAPTPATARPAATPRASPPIPRTRAPATVVVRAGDNLWVIAQRAVRSDRPSAIAPYWRAVVAANTPTLRSRDPNLIYPGEHIVLPPGAAEPPG